MIVSLFCENGKRLNPLLVIYRRAFVRQSPIYSGRRAIVRR
jgi:hypothetical protein